MSETGGKPRSWEVWTGADASSHAWLLYSGVTVAPFGGIHENGLRLRAGGGYGAYRYEREDDAPPPEEDVFKVYDLPKRKFKATVNFSDVLVGYLHRFGPLTTKAFAGVSMIDHTIEPFGFFAYPDADNDVQGTEIGLKGVVELWLNMGDRAWTSVDVSWTEAHETGSGRVRSGYRIVPWLSAGLETVLDSNAEQRQGRGGLFMRYEWDGGELSASGGVSGDLPQPGTLEYPTTPYGTLNWIAHF